MQSQNESLGLGRKDWRFIHVDLRNPATTFIGAMRARCVHEDSPHQLTRQSKELGTVAPVYVLQVYNPDVHFVYQRSRLQGVIGAFVPHVTPRHAPQFLIQQGC
jgi:hypothetical protein